MSTETASSLSPDPRSRAWIEVDPGALRRNYRRLVERVSPGTALVPMVKADGYGLGITRVVDALAPLEPWGWGVATVEEGERLRSHHVAGRVVVFSPLPPGVEERVVAAGLTPSVSDLGTLDRLRGAVEGSVPVHIEIDTGMGRAGFPWDSVAEWAPGLKARLRGALRWEGIYTHFHSADEVGGPEVREQLRRFERVLEVLNPPDSVIRHVQNTAGMLRLEDSGFSLARPGIGLYGGSSSVDLPDPEPVVTLRARVVRVVEVAPGTTLGYGATYRASGTERWATLAIGYGDGYRRAASNQAMVLVSGNRVPVVGRVSMDVTVVNITGLEGVRPGSSATLLGRDGEGEIRLDELAGWVGTIAYEVLTGFTCRLPRVWLPSATD